MIGPRTKLLIRQPYQFTRVARLLFLMRVSLSLVQWTVCNAIFFSSISHMVLETTIDYRRRHQSHAIIIFFLNGRRNDYRRPDKSHVIFLRSKLASFVNSTLSQQSKNCIARKLGRSLGTHERTDGKRKSRREKSRSGNPISRESMETKCFFMSDYIFPHTKFTSFTRRFYISHESTFIWIQNTARQIHSIHIFVEITLGIEERVRSLVKIY